jgi:hypothetical protein
MPAYARPDYLHSLGTCLAVVGERGAVINIAQDMTAHLLAYFTG